MEQKYYIQITKAGTVCSFSGCRITGGDIAQNIEVSAENFETIKADKDKYLYDFKTGEWVKNPEYEANLKLKQAQKRIDEIKAALEELDKQSQRSARAIALCTVNNVVPNPDDVYKLTELENKAGELREELQEIEVSLTPQP